MHKIFLKIFKKTYKGQKEGQNPFTLNKKSTCKPLYRWLTGIYYFLLVPKAGFRLHLNVTSLYTIYSVFYLKIHYMLPSVHFY